MLEKHIQSAIRDRLKAKGYLVVKLVVTSMFGIPDLMAIKDGSVVFIEVKQPGKKPTDLQVATHVKLRRAGAKVLLASSIADIDTLL